MQRPLLKSWWLVGIGSLIVAGVNAGCNMVESPAKSLPRPGGRAQAAAQAPKKPGGIQPALRIAQFVFHCDVPLDESDPLFRDLEQLPDQVQKELRLPIGPQIVQVYLFETQDKYESYMREHYWWLPARRAYFITQPRRSAGGDDLAVYTWLGEQLRVDLRHELTHALLNGVLHGLPLWLDEGLASFFEQPSELDGLNRDHLEKLRRGPFTADLARLESLTKVEDMKTAEYREAWAWVHFMLRGEPEARAALLGYLQERRTQPPSRPLTESLRSALRGEPSSRLYEHLARLPRE